MSLHAFCPSQPSEFKYGVFPPACFRTPSRVIARVRPALRRAAVKEIHRFTGGGVDTVFDGLGGDNLWRSRDALRRGGRLVTCGCQSKMRGGCMASRREGHHPIRESAELGWFILRNWFKPGPKEYGALQHSVVDAIPTRVVPP